jgi:ubiquinone/menaquinone biosynthesis C-methylase UbiE
MDALGIAEGSIVAEIGAASGWFTIRLARRVGPNGFVYAEDVQQPMIEVINRRLPRENLRNVKAFRGESDDPKLPSNALDAILIVDAYHEMEKPIALLRNAARALKDEQPGALKDDQAGRLGIVGFNMSGGGPGPAMEERVDPERVIREANAAGLVLLARPNFLRYQYMLVFGKAKSDPPAKRPTR